MMFRFLSLIFIAFLMGFVACAALVKYRNSVDPPARSEFAITQEYIDSRGLVPTDFFFPVAVKGLTARFYGFEVEGHLFDGGGKCLLIYLHGHHGSFIEYDYFSQLKELAARRGCDTLALDMIGYGTNEAPVMLPTAHGELYLSAFEAKQHYNYRLFADAKHPERTPFQLMLSGHYAIIKQLLPKYSDIRLVGISGGGWATVLLTAKIPEIKKGVSWAGSLPNAFRLDPRDFGDFEQVLPDGVTYWDLYAMGGNRLTLVFNSGDDCCFADPAASAFKDALGSRNKVVITGLKSHTMNAAQADKLLYE